jgi:O-antigen/teichoic acid export membrane protein
MGYGFVAVCAPAVILSPIFFRYWIGADFALVAAPVAQTLFPGMWMSGLSFVAFTLMQSQGRADLTGKLHIAEFLPFLALLWILTSTFGIIGAAAAWTLRCTVDALAMFWASGMRRRDLAQLSPPAALLLATLVLSRFLGSHLVPDFLFAVLAALASLALAYFFSEDWAALMVGVSGRARVFIGGLTSRAKPIPPINTNAQK